MDTEAATELLVKHGLRVTLPRIAVLEVLGSAAGPLSHSDVVEQLAAMGWDPATIYRNLIKLRDAGIAVVASTAEGIDRYAVRHVDGDGHRHPHFLCDQCGRVTCLPMDVMPVPRAGGRWARSIEHAVVQLRGACPDCLAL